MRMDPFHGSNTLPAGHGALRMTTIDPPTRAEESHAPVGQQISFPVLRFSYPLKLIVSRPYRNDLHKLQVGLVYLLNYGGGLLSGDQLALDIHLDDKCQLLCLSQGSTKVFKEKDRSANRFSSPANRDSLYPSSQTTTITPTGTPDVSRQNITAKIGSNATLLMLPSYVTCFRDSSFVQKQIYHLQDHSSSLVCLDWFTSGRSLSTRLPENQNHSNQNESWTFKKFQSFVEVYISSNRIVRENLVLLRDQHHPTQDHFTLYANLYLVCSSDNSKLIKTLDRLKELDRNTNKTRRQQPQSSAKTKDEQQSDQSQLLWCLSELIHHPDPEITPTIHPPPPDLRPLLPRPSVRTAIIRIGSYSSILVRDWLEKNLADLQELIGPEFYRNCF
ncbi:hypothetical protein PtA15_1A223 [Puccinia triticina]|uniref:Urease accessory protein UreD n=1 Tax=Puccinia triticina TaxID=208348 RepID=A0ABY7CAG9_9BASI|nr:uncharacterized protein PtA15_1A223 [Puccinia triticina]WAQ80885.1 hypothetical protein PtA15_1A223 [Puccinia triticina]WAR51779.1 hypothetical protein PtB15_1B215 [Puccinia triticina]